MMSTYDMSASHATREVPLFHQVLLRHLLAVLKTERAATDHILKSFPPVELAYRAISPRIPGDGGCVIDTGLFSRTRGYHEHGQPWNKEAVVQHLKDAKPEDNSRPSSPYMSISTSPQYIVKFIAKWPSSKDIAIIDMEMMRKMAVDHRCTTDLRDDFKLVTYGNGPGRAPYMFDHHWLVYDHIPQCCIMGYVSGPDFIAVCQANGMVVDGPADLDYDRRLTWADLRPNARRSTTFAKPPDFALLSPLRATRLTSLDSDVDFLTTVRALPTTRNLSPPATERKKRPRDISPDTPTKSARTPRSDRRRPHGE